MSDKEINKKQDSDEKEYALYTERIVQSPKAKYKKYINGVRTVLIAGALILALSLFIRYVIPWYGENFPQKQVDRDELTIEKDEYDGEGLAVLEGDDSLNLGPRDNAGEITGLDSYQEIMNALRLRVAEIKKSIVAIDRYPSSLNRFVQEDVSPTETCALIIGYVNSEYVLISKASAIGEADDIIVRFSTGEELEGNVKCRDKDTDLAVITIRAVDMSYTMLKSVKVAALDNSYNVHQGDLFLAYGRLYGQNKAVDYGTVSEKTSKVTTDNTFEIFNSNLAYYEGDSSFIFNSSGNVIGISTVTSGSTLSIIGISDLKALIEAMANKGGYAYFGIMGRNVTADMVELYDLPMGIFISEVEVDSPAYNAGLQAGDVICGINGSSVLTIQLFSEKLYQCSDGQNVFVKAMRMGKDGYYDVKFNVTVTIG
ncbi:MAG: S1C family serine protease [Eubacteriales bacterium]|nr:S1C family serine protease [Eubacteriales bacterium]